MAKKKNTPLGIFIESIGLYFSNFDKFIKYMSFPVLGQVGGLLLVFLLTFFYSKHMPILIEKYSLFDNFYILVLCAVLITLPGLAIFLKAFFLFVIT